MEIPPYLTIAFDPRKPGQKSRAFSVRLLAFLSADRLWTCDGTAAIHPAWIAYYGSDQESRAFTANFRASRAATSGLLTLEIQRKAGFRWTTQRVSTGILTVGYLPELFHLEPIALGGGPVRFIFAPPSWWIEEQAAHLAPEFGDDARDVARAALFTAYLDRRTPLPIVHDLRFHLQLFRAAQECSWIEPFADRPSTSSDLFASGIDILGLDPPLACDVDPETLSAFLIDQTALFHKEQTRHAQTRLPAGGRILPFPAPSATQLRLDFALA